MIRVDEKARGKYLPNKSLTLKFYRQSEFDHFQTLLTCSVDRHTTFCLPLEITRCYFSVPSWLPYPFFTKWMFYIFLGEAGRDHRGAVQRSGERGNPVPPKCWGVGGGPGGMVGHLNAYQPWRKWWVTLISIYACLSWNWLMWARWGLAPETRSPLREWLCVDKLEMCCPQDHFGPKCQPCAVLGLGDKVWCQDNSCLSMFNCFYQVCGGNGKCKGSGTRKGNGKCSCNKVC